LQITEHDPGNLGTM